ncbi:hypothetical protein K501DRAFT_288952 [Backusella circina FSU 941]|nr:hypothetical protein K501DRAFT_288952 [Backusella circina FSU 941]
MNINKNRHPKLPSISTLLTTPQIVVNEQEEPRVNPTCIPVVLSPMLSPVDSYSPPSKYTPGYLFEQPPSPSPSLLSVSSTSLPPLQGDDPPQKLQRHPSFSSSTSPKPLYNSIWSTQNSVSNSTSPSPPSPPSPMLLDSEVNTPLLEAQPENFNESQSDEPASTQIIITEEGQPVLKRRRGRPPSTKEPTSGGWTFLTPTVWDVNSHLPYQSDSSETESIMNGSMAAFTSSSMDMVLDMPRKKRGRKPKTQIEGNSCFVLNTRCS